MKLNGRETDGLFVSDDQINIIEATTSRAKDKAAKDGQKLKKLVDQHQRAFREYAVKGWFITREEPTADQRGEINALRTPQVVAMSFDQFRARLIDALGYLDLRAKYPWGSARDPEHDDYVEASHYVPVGLSPVRGGADHNWTVGSVAAAATTGASFGLLGDYGAGKSMTMRAISLELAHLFRRGKTARFPVTLNLGEHKGQTDPAEALERHARRIGFARPDHLVRAWRSGYVTLLLDGFDEMASLNWSAGGVGHLQAARRRAVELVRRFMYDKPGGTGVVTAGRLHYFDSNIERSESLGFGGGVTELALSDFSNIEVQQFLRNSGLTADMPPWLPSRPLLLGYLAARGLLSEALSVDDKASPAVGWDALLDRIAEREARIEAGIDGPTVRRIMETIAGMARGTSGGLGPLSFFEIETCFRHVIGRAPDEDSLILLQRLPGLGTAGNDGRDRVFIDETLTDAARAGDTVRFLQAPHNFESVLSADRWQTPVQEVGAEVAALRWESQGGTSQLTVVGLEHAASVGLSALAADLLQVAASEGADTSDVVAQIRDAYFGSLSLGDTEADLSGVTLTACLIQEITLDLSAGAAKLPTLVGCVIGRLEGSGEHDLPADRFVECEVQEFGDGASTTAGIMSLGNLPAPTRVMLAILKKIYFQRGTGRKASALVRGLSPESRKYVEPVLQLLSREGLVHKSRGRNELWLPDRSKTNRIKALVYSPQTCGDPILEGLETL